MSTFRRALLAVDSQQPVVESLQSVLVDLIDLSLIGKQAHWTVVGETFLSVHEQLDEIIDEARDASDQVAERIVTLGAVPDGGADTVSKSSRLDAFPVEFQGTGQIITSFADRMATTIAGLRDAIRVTGEHDPITEDLLIGLTAGLEKHLWMLQAQEVIS